MSVCARKSKQEWQHSLKRDSKYQIITNDKYRVAANKTARIYHIAPKLIFLRILHDHKAIISTTKNEINDNKQIEI